MKKFTLLKAVVASTFICLMLISVGVKGQVDGDYQTRATGNWNAYATWQVRSSGAWVDCVDGDYPGATAGAGKVYINNDDEVTLNVTIDSDHAIGALDFKATANATKLIISGTYELNITGDVTFVVPTVKNIDQTLDISSGVLNCTSIIMPETDNNNYD